MRKQLREDLGMHLYTHLVKELPFIRSKLTNAEINMLVNCMAKWFVDEGADPILLAKAVIKIMNEENRPVVDKATPEPEFMKELDKV